MFFGLGLVAPLRRHVIIIRRAKQKLRKAGVGRESRARAVFRFPDDSWGYQSLSE